MFDFEPEENDLTPEEKIQFLISELKNQNYQKRKDAARSLAEMKNQAVAPLKNALLNNPDEDIKYWATIILGRIGDSAINVLIEILNSSDKDLKVFAIRSLGETLDPRAIPHLIKILGDKSWSVRKNAAASIMKFGEAAVHPIAEALGSNNEDIRYWATKILGELGGSGVEPLLKMLKMENKDMRFFATLALAKTQDIRAIRQLINCFRDESWTIRKSAAEALEQIGEKAIEPLTIALSHEDKDVRYWTTRVLGKIGAKSIQPVLKLLKDDDTEVRQLSKKILANIGTLAVEPLIKILKFDDKDMRIVFFN